MPVSEGDTILVPVADLDTQKEHPVDVTWRQGLAAVSEKYIQTTFTITKTKDGAGQTGSETQGIIFVQLSMLEGFKKKKVADQAEVTVVVDKDFEYGQKKDGTGRWLCYHDKKNRPFQHRFISATIKGAVDRAAGIAKMLGFGSGEALLKDMGMFVGDHLNPFK